MAFDSPGRFRIDWVLVDELAIGPAPRSVRHLDRLQHEGVRAVISLCSEQEAPAPVAMEQRFECRRVVLPDHRSDRALTVEDLGLALACLEELWPFRPVFVHCAAAMERSPLLCMAWLITRHGQRAQDALDYLMQIHPGTNPLPSQWQVLKML